MTKISCAAFLISALAAGAAFADSDNSNSGAATNMAEVLSGTPGIGGAAPTVSGEEFRGDSGWGNNGSEIVAGDKVARGK